MEAVVPLVLFWKWIRIGKKRLWVLGDCATIWRVFRNLGYHIL